MGETEDKAGMGVGTDDGPACHFCRCTENAACLISTPSSDRGAVAPGYLGQRPCGWANKGLDPARDGLPVCDSPNCLARLIELARTDPVAAATLGVIRRDNPASLAPLKLGFDEDHSVQARRRGRDGRSISHSYGAEGRNWAGE